MRPTYVGLFLDAAAMQAGDMYEIAMYEKVVAGGPQRRWILASLVGTQASPFIEPAEELLNGWDFTLTKIQGVDRSFSWSIRGVI